ncbi:Ig-like domain-containing protein [Hyalangium gracile]|uniref:Ig-like domain-containing protein n=1 Tax=Hyalangium gracile TaxID=394092 RepID=UPI001CCB36B1|nr:putative Ig domain-containing protein [Hyalangium gracile]
MRSSSSRLLLFWVFVGLWSVACGEDSAPGNQPPTLTGPTAQTPEVRSGAPVALTLEATDPDGDALTYAWGQTPPSPAGTFSDAASATPSWTAPQVTVETQFQLGVTVSDGKNGSVHKSVTVRVLPPLPANRAPVLSQAPMASPSSVTGAASVQLSVAASDPDGDTLSYAWSQVFPAAPMGTFSSASSANPTWTAPNVSANSVYALRVTVTDGKGGSVQGTVEINVGVSQGNRPPTVAASITGPSTLLAGDTGTFSLTASDADGDPLTWSWTQSAPATQGTFMGSTTSSSAQWFSPVVATQTSFTLSVTVTDGKSPAVARTLTVPVTVPRYTDVQKTWEAVPCTSCHGTAGGVNLRFGMSYASLVNVNANACGLKRVVPGDPNNSAIVLKMEGNACGTRMPSNDQAYFDDNPGMVVRVRSWILAGAAND